MNNLTEIAKQKLKCLEGFISANNYNIVKVEKNYCEMEGIITKTSMNNLKIVNALINRQMKIVILSFFWYNNGKKRGIIC